jgi:hypothetical protein
MLSDPELEKSSSSNLSQTSSWSSDYSELSELDTSGDGFKEPMTELTSDYRILDKFLYMASSCSSASDEDKDASSTSIGF